LEKDITLKLGLIGFSEGNGHPYSWAAICNGYSPVDMAKCEFPAITQYLNERPWPESRLSGVEVSHIWTQDQTISNRVASASKILKVVQNPIDMIGNVDGLLLARDDAENHLKYAAPFLKAGIPVYIDKPIALSLDELEALYKLQTYQGQIFTCSALRYAKELMLSESDRDRIGQIRHIQATTPNSWEKYAVHIIEPSLQIIGAPVDIASARSHAFVGDGRSVSVGFENGITADFSAFGKGIATPLSLRVHGENGWIDLVFKDSFSCFKAALNDFLESVKSKTCRSPKRFNQQVVSIINEGVKS